MQIKTLYQNYMKNLWKNPDAAAEDFLKSWWKRHHTQANVGSDNLTVVPSALPPQSVTFIMAMVYVFHDEGSAVFSDPADGEYSKYGITLALLQANGIHADKSYIANLDEATAEDLYWSLFWEPLHFDLIASPWVASKCFNIDVNVGAQTGIRLLQQAVNAIHGGPLLAVDGILGLETAAAVNAIAPATVVQAFETQAITHYEEIVAANPSKQKYLAGWLARVAEATANTPQNNS